jgi:hypothetical protein
MTFSTPKMLLGLIFYGLEWITFLQLGVYILCIHLGLRSPFLKQQIYTQDNQENPK